MATVKKTAKKASKAPKKTKGSKGNASIRKTWVDKDNNRAMTVMADQKNKQGQNYNIFQPTSFLVCNGDEFKVGDRVQVETTITAV